MSKKPGSTFSDSLKVNSKNGKFSFKSKLDSDNGIDIYRFNFLNRSSFDCTLGKASGNVKLTLFDRRKKVVATSNEKDGLSESIKLKVKAGVYFLKVERIQGEYSYKLNSKVVELPGSKFSDSLKISPGKKLKGKFLFTGELDDDAPGGKFAFYRFKLSEPSAFRSVLFGLKGNADIDLFDGRRQLILSSNKSGNLPEEFGQLLKAGTYFIKVKLKGGSTKFKLRCNFTPVDIDGGGNTSDDARPITIGQTGALFGGVISSTFDPDDYYKVDVASPSSLKLTLDGLSANADLQLLNQDGTVVASSANTGTTADLIDTALKAGSYYVRVSQTEPNAFTTYNLKLESSTLNLFGLADNNTLVAFNADKLDKSVSLGVTGLASGETLKSIDFRPTDGKLYGLSNTSQLYTIDLKNGTATKVGSAVSPALTGTGFGFDFNPDADRIRVVSDADTNVRLTPTGSATTDPVLAYDTLDSNAVANPNVTALAYSNNPPSFFTSTLFGIDTTLNTLVRQGSSGGSPISPDAGTLFTVGALGFDVAPDAGFDIFTDASLTNKAYLTSGASLYEVNLTTGTATSLGTVTLSGSSTSLNLVGLAHRVA